MENQERLKMGDLVCYKKDNTIQDAIYKITDVLKVNHYGGTIVNGNAKSDSIFYSANFRKATVEDYIKAMDTERLAIFLRSQDGYACKLCNSVICTDCTAAMKKWLSQELTYDIIREIQANMNVVD